MKPPTDKEMIRIGVDDDLRNTAEAVAVLALEHNKLCVHVCKVPMLRECAMSNQDRLHIVFDPFSMEGRKRVCMQRYSKHILGSDQTQVSNIGLRTLKRYTEIVMYIRRQKAAA